MTDIAGLVSPLRFHLTDQDGRALTAADFHGDVVLLYFGYTHCPDACPTTLATLANALRTLGPQASSARVLFVTVDPRRDTAAVLKQYVSAFGPQFIGLRGDSAELTDLMKRYRVSIHYEKPDKTGAYAVDHSSAVFIFGKNGRARLLAEEGAAATAVAADLRPLLTGA